MFAKDNSISKQMIKMSVKKYLHSLLAVFALSALAVGLTAIVPVIYQKITDEFIPEKNLRALIICVVIAVLAPVAAALVTLLKNKLNYWFGKKCVYYVTDAAFKKILHSNFAEYSSYDSVTLSNILTRSAETIPSMYLNSIITIVSSCLQFLIVFVMLLHYNIALTLSVFAVLPLSYLIIKAQKNKMKSASHDGLKEQRSLQKNIVQILNSMKTIRSYNAQEGAENSFEDGLNRFNKAEWKFRKTECLAGDVLPNAASQIILGTAFALGALFVLKDKMSVGSLIAVIAYFPSLMSSLNGIMRARLSVGAAQNVFDEFDNIMAMSDELSSDIIPDKSCETVFSFENVEFSYGRENFSLHIDDLKIKKGEFISIVGVSGGGKSCFMDIVNKFFSASSGTIRVFGKNINEVDTDSLRKMYSVVLQDAFIFNDAVENNISFPQAPDSLKISQAIEKAQMKDFIGELPEHEKTVISDFGANLSGGECQRISVARALYRDAPVMLLDEPTSALDAKTAGKMFEMLQNECKVGGKTVVVITHDIKRAAMADKVIVINGGKITEQGGPQELLKKDGAFKSLFEAQDNIKAK